MNQHDPWMDGTRSFTSTNTNRKAANIFMATFGLLLTAAAALVMLLARALMFGLTESSGEKEEEKPTFSRISYDPKETDPTKYSHSSWQHWDGR